MPSPSFQPLSVRAARSDEELLPRARNGDEDAVRALVTRYNQRLFRVARGIVGNDAEAEDVVQETYVRAFFGLDGFRGDALLSTWLTRIALNEALGRLRRRRPSAELSELDGAGAAADGRVVAFPLSPMAASPESEAARTQMRQVLEQAVDDLPDRFRMVFILRDIQGLSTEETAAALAIRAVTVKTRLHRGRRLMRRAVEKRFSRHFSDLFPFDGARCANMAGRVVAQQRSRLT